MQYLLLTHKVKGKTICNMNQILCYKLENIGKLQSTEEHMMSVAGDREDGDEAVNRSAILGDITAGQAVPDGNS